MANRDIIDIPIFIALAQAPATAGTAVFGVLTIRQDIHALRRYRNRMLEVGGGHPIAGYHRPLIGQQIPPGRPATTIGSTASVIPSRSTKSLRSCSNVTKFGTFGSSCIERPMPWPTNSQTTLKPCLQRNAAWPWRCPTTRPGLMCYTATRHVCRVTSSIRWALGWSFPNRPSWPCRYNSLPGRARSRVTNRPLSTPAARDAVNDLLIDADAGVARESLRRPCRSDSSCSGRRRRPVELGRAS